MHKRILAIFLLLPLSVSLAACGTNNTNNPPAKDPSVDETPDTPTPEELFEIYRDGAIISKIIIPADYTSDELSIAKGIRGTIFMYTRQQPTIIYDNEVEEAPAGAIIVGKTCLPESVALYETLPARSAAA